MSVVSIIAIVLLCWFTIGFVVGILSMRYVDREWPKRREALYFTLGGVLTVLLCFAVVVGESIGRINRSGWWERKLFEKDPYEYHKY